MHTCMRVRFACSRQVGTTYLIYRGEGEDEGKGRFPVQKDWEYQPLATEVCVDSVRPDLAMRKDTLSMSVCATIGESKTSLPIG